MAILFIILAAFFKAVADVLMFHFETSVFKKKDGRFWNPEVSWKYVKFLPLTKYRPDGWHLANSLMIVSFICFGVFHLDGQGWAHKWWFELPAAGIIYNVVFNLFYDKILR